MIRKLFYNICSLALLLACSIENDIPYPLVEGAILSIEVEGQRGGADGESSEAVINKTNRTVTLFVNDSVDISKLKIKRLKITEGAQLTVDETVCLDAKNFPTTGFASLDSISSTANTRVDFTKPVSFMVNTYQDYTWKVTVTQIVNREVDVTNQVGNAVLDSYNHTAIIYVTSDQSLTDLQVKKMNLGGEYGHVEPDPTKITDYSSPRQFYVAHSWEDTMTKWTVYFYQSLGGDGVNGKMSVNPWSNFAYLEGALSAVGDDVSKCVFQYKQVSESEWSDVLETPTLDGNTCKVTLRNLSPNTAYQCRMSYDSGAVLTSAVNFTTETQNKISNLSFDDWVKNEKHYYAALSVDSKFWDSGNEGANTLQEVNPTQPIANDVVKGKAAKLWSTTAAGIFAAASLFTGDFGEAKISPPGADLSFGQPFTERPSQLTGWYKYNPGMITHTKVSGVDKGDRDSCSIYIALTDWTAPFAVSTAKGVFVDFSDSHIIAYGELSKAEMSPTSMSSYKQFTIDLKYRSLLRKPTYVLIVCSSSKYGDYFTGSTNSVLLLDEFDLLYGEPISN